MRDEELESEASRRALVSEADVRANLAEAAGEEILKERFLEGAGSSFIGTPGASGEGREVEEAIGGTTRGGGAGVGPAGASEAFGTTGVIFKTGRAFEGFGTGLTRTVPALAEGAGGLLM
jgi:hypothetical protein